MEAADDIVLGELSEADLADLAESDGASSQQSEKQNSLISFRSSIAISLCFHLTLAAAAFYFIASEVGGSENTAPTSLRVQFVPARPMQPEADSISENIAEDDAEVDQVETPATPSEVEPSSAPEPRESVEPDPQLPALAELDTVELENSSPPAQDRGEVDVPTFDSVRDAISSVRSNERSQFFTSDCNKFEEEQEFNNCKQRDTRDYSAATKNPVYDYFSPALEISRSRATVSTIARQSAAVSQALALNDLPAGLSAYVLEEIEQGIETYSNNSSRVLNHMTTMLDKSDAGIQARRIFTPWVQQQSAILRSRKVENWPDAVREEKCKSYEEFASAPAEFTECLFR